MLPSLCLNFKAEYETYSIYCHSLWVKLHEAYFIDTLSKLNDHNIAHISYLRLNSSYLNLMIKHIMKLFLSDSTAAILNKMFKVTFAASSFTTKYADLQDSSLTLEMKNCADLGCPVIKCKSRSKRPCESCFWPSLMYFCAWGQEMSEYTVATLTIMHVSFGSALYWQSMVSVWKGPEQRETLTIYGPWEKRGRRKKKRAHMSEQTLHMCLYTKRM